jgi:hypothetical protein
MLLTQHLDASSSTVTESDPRCFDLDERPTYRVGESADECDLCEDDEVVWEGYVVCLSGYSHWRLCDECSEALHDGRCECVGCGEVMMTA